MGGGTTRNMWSSFQIQINCVKLHLVGYILEYMYEECNNLSVNCAFVGHCTKYKKIHGT